MLKAQREMTCTSIASDGERASLGVQWFPDGISASPAAMRNVERYVTGAGTHGEHRLFRYLSVLAGFAYQANYSNDQFLRSRFDGLILGHSAAGVDYASPGLMTQIFLCSQARLMSAMIESGQSEYVNALAVRLAENYARLSDRLAVTDWPLIVALRLVTVSPDGHARAINDLTATMLNRALALESRDPRRASRLFAEAAAGRYQTGAARETITIGARSIALLPAAEKPMAAWRAYPAMYDAMKITGATEPPSAAQLTETFFANYGYPEETGDYATDFAINLRLAEVFREIGKDNTNFWVLAFNALRKLNHDVVTHEFLREGLRQLAAMTERPVDMLLRTRTMHVAQRLEIAKAKALYDYVLDRRRATVQIDVGTQILLSYMNESILYSLSRIEPRNAIERAMIADLGFRALQLDSFTRISVAAAASGIRNLPMDKDRRFHLERFYTYTADHSAWLDATGLRIAVGPGQPLPDAGKVSTAFFTIATFQNETEAKLPEYYAILEKLAPGTYAMTVPYAQSLESFQEQLPASSAVVASVVGTTESYVWGIRNDRAMFARTNRNSDELSAAVTTLRASLSASGSGSQMSVPPYEAGIAWDLYASTIGKVRTGLEGARHVYWYGDGVLGALPPAILVTTEPKKRQMSDLEDFNATRFFVDDYSLSSLPDLFLGKTNFLKQGRKPAAVASFAGFGAPQLSARELQQETLASSFELAGGVAVNDLKSLPKLPASKTELESLSRLFDDSRIWLGGNASEKNLHAAALDTYRVIAFATHGFTRSDIQGQIYPSLMMAPPEAQTTAANDGLLTSLEIGRLELNADVVLLSACNTATSDGRPDAEAFSGLAQAFLVAGARSLMVSHWPVASGASGELSVGTIEQWQAGDSLAGGLQKTVQRMRAGATSDLEAHPFFWGPFVIANDGGETAGR